MDTNKKSSFDKLVTGLTTDDRNAMLERINSSITENVEFTEIRKTPLEYELTLTQQLENESFLYRFLLWVRSFIKQKTKENIYNEDILIRVAKKISREHVGLINYKHKVLDSFFYERLRSLKDVSDYFKPYMLLVDENPGDFYVFLSSFVAPELVSLINETADPFTLSFGQQPTIEVKDGLMKKLDEILNYINEKTKANLYLSIVKVNWLNEFTKLPFIHFNSQFNNLSGKNFTCPYNRATYDYNMFASVLSNIDTISNEVLEAIFLYSRRKDLSDQNKSSEIERDLQEFMSLSNQYLTLINDFLSNIPIVELGKVVTQDYNWEPGSISGVEAWFASFRSQWRKVIEVRWNDWEKERKKNQLEKNLLKDFNLKSFPVLKYRPWNLLWMHVPFACELTGGFLSWFALEKYTKIIDPLNCIMLDGIFIRSENKSEFTENLNLFSQCNNRMKNLITKLSPEGEYGMAFKEMVETKVRTINVQNQIEKIIMSTENEIREITKIFGKSCRAIERVFHGLFDDKKDGIHEGLQNLNTIKGSQNKEWKDHVYKVREIMKKCIFYISELEPIDAASRNV